jgi:hypothetical protein
VALLSRQGTGGLFCCKLPDCSAGNGKQDRQVEASKNSGQNPRLNWARKTRPEAAGILVFFKKTGRGKIGETPGRIGQKFTTGGMKMKMKKRLGEARLETSLKTYLSLIHI